VDPMINFGAGANGFVAALAVEQEPFVDNPQQQREEIVLGGGLSNMDHLYTDVPPLLKRYVFSDVIETPVLKNLHGDSSGVRGAAWLWPAE
jgi:predicted NBD/HSP70 family sugar kinase